MPEIAVSDVYLYTCFQIVSDLLTLRGGYFILGTSEQWRPILGYKEFLILYNFNGSLK